MISKYAAALLAATAFVAMPAQAAPSLTGPQAAAAFGARERIIDVSLSPDGTKIAVVVPGPQQSTIVQVIDLTTGTANPINVADGNPLSISNCNWASNARLVCSMYGVSDRQGIWLPYVRHFAMSVDGSAALPLVAMEKVQNYSQQYDGYVVDWRDGKTDKVLFARNYVAGKADILASGGGMAEGLGVDLLDTRSGKVEHIESPSPRAEVYLGDGQGTIRIMGTDEALRSGYETKGRENFFYRLPGSRDWKPFSIYSSIDETGMYPVGVDGPANVAYVLEKKDGRDALYRVKLDGSMKKELAFADPHVDISGIVKVGRQGHIVGASFSRELPEVHYFDPAYEDLMVKLGKALPNLPLIRIVDSSADEHKHIVYAAGDVEAGRYFLYDSTTHSLSMIGQDRPELASVPLGKVKPVTYRAADGTQIPAYLTLPPGSDGKKIPAIIMPHGGPAARDEWGFDWLSQFFVNRGYAVLQPNYRGSTGYGQEWFQQNGFKSWKIAIGDVNDAGRWLVSEGIADPSKLAIVGWSYGGYAALQANVLDPNLFKAAIAVAPVTDLGALRDEKRGFTNSTVARNYIGEGPHLEEGSPARHAGAFKVPVLMFHGEKDINVNIAESRLMDRNLKKAGKSSELVIYPKIDHQLSDSTVRTDMLTRADAFLTKALGR
jgi:dienelactone hydrolase